MAKDVTTFLSWTAEPELDERKKMGLQAVVILSTMTAISLYVKRAKWVGLKNRKICEYSDGSLALKKREQEEGWRADVRLAGRE